jgi:hypothetical protein
MSGRAALAGRHQPIGPQDLAHRLARDLDPLPVRELLRQVVVVEAAVLPPRQLDNPLPSGGGQLPRRGPAAIAMDHPPYSLLSDPDCEPIHVALGDPEHHGGLGHRQLLAKDPFDYREALLLFHCQDYGLHSLT